MDYLLGIDLGTSGVRAAIVDSAGTVFGVGRMDYAIATSRPGWAEQDPAMWIEATAAATRAALSSSGVKGEAIRAIGLSGQMHTTVCLDREGHTIRPAILWADQRSREEVAEARRRLGAERLARWTQNPLAAGFTLATLLWLQAYEPATWSRLAHVLLPKDYLRLYLTGNYGTDGCDASATLLMDVACGTWSSELLDVCAIDPAWLPEIHNAAEPAGTLLPGPAEALGLRAGIPVAFGTGDQAAQAVGNAVIEQGVLSCTIGTGGQLLAPSRTARYDPALRLHTFCHARPAWWFVMAATLSAGLSLSWLRDQVLGHEPFAALADAAAEVQPGADGLFFLPYLAGERTPHMDAAARGVFAGLTLRHGRSHLVRAVMEGVVFSLREGLDLIEGLGLPVSRVVASGGGTRHPLWLQLQADILDRPIYQTRTTEAAALGAALLGGVAAGIYDSVENACAAAVRLRDEVIEPDPARTALYASLFQRYRALYPALRGFFASEAPEGA